MDLKFIEHDGMQTFIFILNIPTLSSIGKLYIQRLKKKRQFHKGTGRL